MRVSLKSMRVTAEDMKSFETDDERYDRIFSQPARERTDADLDWAHAYYRPREQKKIDDAAKSEREKFESSSIGKFISSIKNPTAAARAKAALERGINNNGDLHTRSSLVEAKVAAGYRVVLLSNGKRRLQIPPDGAFLDEAQISKTAMDYAEFLINNL